MNMTLQNLRLENFKGIHNFEATFDGQDARILAENGAGKTTLFDAWLWLLFGKDSTGRKDFEVRPLGFDNHPLKGLIVLVEATIAVGQGGGTHTLRKEQHEKVVKDQFRGYETLCWIDEVPKKVGEFQEFIDSLVPEEQFKMLADLSYFNAKLHHTERRKMLLALAGNVASPQGWENLLAVLKGRSVKDFEKVLKDQKNRHTKDRDEINPRIDEIHRGLLEYYKAGHPLAHDHSVDDTALQAKRQAIQDTIADLDEQRKTLLDDEKARQDLINRINHLTVQRLDRQSQMRSEGNQTQALLAEKARIAANLAEKEEAVNALHRQIKSIERDIELAQTELKQTQQFLDRARAEIEAVDKVNIASVCYACGQKLPKAKAEENQTKQQAQKQALIQNAEKFKEAVNANDAKIEQLQQQRTALSGKAAELYKSFRELCDSANVRKAEIDAAIANRPEPNYSLDPEYDKLNWQITELQAQVGAPVAEQLDAIEARKTQAEAELDKLNAALAQADRAKADKVRIAELEAKEKDLAQKIAQVDQQLADCAAYRAAESRLIETAVNGRFTHIQFKLFNYNLNGSIEECCEATLNGVPYADMSTGQQILAGVDVINALSEHYGISVPLWIDHAESLTLPLEAKSQVVELYAQKGVHELTIEIEEKAAVAA